VNPEEVIRIAEEIREKHRPHIIKPEYAFFIDEKSNPSSITGEKVLVVFPPPHTLDRTLAVHAAEHEFHHISPDGVPYTLFDDRKIMALAMNELQVNYEQEYEKLKEVANCVYDFFVTKEALQEDPKVTKEFLERMFAASGKVFEQNVNPFALAGFVFLTYCYSRMTGFSALPSEFTPAFLTFDSKLDRIYKELDGIFFEWQRKPHKEIADALVKTFKLFKELENFLYKTRASARNEKNQAQAQGQAQGQAQAQTQGQAQGQAQAQTQGQTQAQGQGQTQGQAERQAQTQGQAQGQQEGARQGGQEEKKGSGQKEETQEQRGSAKGQNESAEAALPCGFTVKTSESQAVAVAVIGVEAGLSDEQVVMLLDGVPREKAEEAIRKAKREVAKKKLWKTLSAFLNENGKPSGALMTRRRVAWDGRPWTLDEETAARNPYEPDKWKERKKEVFLSIDEGGEGERGYTEVVIVFDKSGSTKEDVADGKRVIDFEADAATAAVALALEMRKPVTIVPFSTEASEMSFGKNYVDATQFLLSIKPEGDTELETAVEVVKDRKRALIVILTDGFVENPEAAYEKLRFLGKKNRVVMLIAAKDANRRENITHQIAMDPNPNVEVYLVGVSGLEKFALSRFREMNRQPF